MKLERYDAARQALSEAHRVDEVKDIRDKAIAMAAYAKQAKDTRMVEWVTEIRVRAERRLGEMLREQKATVGMNTGAAGSAGPGRGNEVPIENRVSVQPTLASVGIDKKLSSRAQKLAEMPEEHFETAIDVAKEQVSKLTMQNLIRIGKELRCSEQTERLMEDAEARHARWRREHPDDWAHDLWDPIIGRIDQLMTMIVQQVQKQDFTDCPVEHRESIARVWAQMSSVIELHVVKPMKEAA